MSDIFISYAKEDRARAQLFAQALARQGWSVFWDRTIAAGRTWRDTIGRELEQARCVVVLWSPHSIISDWVLDEADDARERRVLVPVLIANVRPPMGSRNIQAANLSHWHGTEIDPAFHRLVADIATHIGPSPKEVAGERQRVEATEAARLAEAERKRHAIEEAARQAEQERQKAEVLRLRAEEARRIREEAEAAEAARLAEEERKRRAIEEAARQTEQERRSVEAERHKRAEEETRCQAEEAERLRQEAGAAQWAEEEESMRQEIASLWEEEWQSMQVQGSAQWAEEESMRQEIASLWEEERQRKEVKEAEAGKRGFPLRPLQAVALSGLVGVLGVGWGIVHVGDVPGSREITTIAAPSGPAKVAPVEPVVEPPRNASAESFRRIKTVAIREDGGVTLATAPAADAHPSAQEATTVLDRGEKTPVSEFFPDGEARVIPGVERRVKTIAIRENNGVNPATAPAAVERAANEAPAPTEAPVVDAASAPRGPEETRGLIPRLMQGATPILGTRFFYTPVPVRR